MNATLVWHCLECKKELSPDLFGPTCSDDCWHAHIERIEREEKAEADRIEKQKVADEAKRVEAAQKSAWRLQMLPRAFIDYEGLPPAVDAKASESALAWYDLAVRCETNKPHLYLHGPSGVGKTWTCHRIIHEASHDTTVKQLHTGAIIRCSGLEFQREVPARIMRESDGNLDEYLKPLREAWLLIIDEVDKLSGSARVSLEFFDLINERIDGEQPTVLASFANPLEVVQLLNSKSSKQLGPQISRRLREFFTIIELKKGQP